MNVGKDCFAMTHLLKALNINEVCVLINERFRRTKACSLY